MSTKRLFLFFSAIINVAALVVLVNLVNTPGDINELFRSSESEVSVENGGEVFGEKVSVDENIEKVEKVIDGDTIALSTGEIVRYIGIDTPENPTKKNEECYALLAYNKNREMVEGKSVYLEKDVSETDRYGRLLRYVWTLNSKGEKDDFVNEVLVSQGYAFATSYPPDVKYQDRLRLAEIDSKENNLGLWGSCFVGEEKVFTLEGEWDCSSNVYDCGEFLNQKEAQEVFDLCGSDRDIHQLDSDGDKVACESLP